MRRTSLVLCLALIVASGSLAQTTYTVPTDGTLQAVVAGAVTGDTVYILDGPYTLNSTLNIAQGITLSGQSELGVVIDVSCGTGYGIHPSVGGVVLENFTLNVTEPVEAGYIIHASGTPNVQDGLTVHNVTIQGGAALPKRRAGLDIHGYDNVVLDNVTSNDATWGNGIQLTGCHHVTVNNCSTTNNAWGSLAIYCSQYLVPTRACDDVYVNGDNCTFNEQNVFVEDQFGLTSTNVDIDGYEYMLRNDEYRAGAEGFIHYQDTLADAQAFAAIVFAGFEDATSFQEILTGDFVIFAGMSIQAAIDAADPGDTVEVAAGTYTENIDVNKRLTLVGAGSGNNPAVDTIITQNPAGSGDSRVGVVQLTASGASAVDPILLQDLRIGADGMAGISVGRFTEATGVTVEYVALDNVHVIGTNVNPSTEQERGLYVDLTSNLRYLDVDDCAFDNLTYGWYFQKQVSADASTVQYVTVDNTTFNHNNHKGIYAEKLSDATFTACTADDNGYDSSALPSYFQAWSCGIDLNLKAGTYSNFAFVDCIITDNAIDEAKEGVGLTVKGRDDGGYAGFPAIVDNVQVTGCTVTGNERGLRFGEPGKFNATPTNVVVSGCTLMNNTQHYSGVDGTAYGDFVNESAAADDAAGNWWGDTDPSDQVAGSGATVYSPWLNAVPGTTPMTWGVNTSIQAAIDAADPGDTILVDPGSYVESLLIEKSLFIFGATSGVNKNGYAVPADYAWDPAIESIITHPDPAGGYVTIVDIHDTGDVTFDGFVVGEVNAVANANTSLVRVYAHTQAISNVKVENCVIGPNTNTTAQDGAQGRMGLYIVNHPYDVNGVENSSFSHNKIFDCKGNGDNIFLWTSYYAYGAAGPADMTGTVIDDNEIYGSHRAGIETAGGFANLTISNNTIYGNSQLPGDDPDFLKYGHGIQLIRGSSDKVSDPLTAYGPVDLLIIGNEIYGNSKCGVYMGPKNDGITFTDNVIHDNGWNGVMVDLVGNYWNPQFESPPTSEQYACYDCSDDVSGSGNEIYDNGTTGNPLADFGVAVNGVPTNSFVFDAKDNWWGSASGPYHDTLNTSGTGNPVTDYVEFEPWSGMGTVAALPVASGPINCGETVTLNFHYTPDTYTPELRGFTITVDCSAELSFGAADIHDLGVFDSFGSDYFTTLDNGDGTFTVDSAILGGTTGLAAEADLFSITFHPVSDGDGTVTVPAIILRDMDNIDIGATVTGAIITVDCTLPPGVTDLTSAPGHEKVTLDWTMADASDVDHYEVWRAVWNQGVGSELVSAYPEYDDDNVNEPVWPADHDAADTSDEWVKLTTIPDPLPGTAVGYVDGYAPRGIYYYEVYAVDAAGNIGPGAGPMNRSTNYWLGDVDVTWDGDVDVLDIDELGTSYGFGDGDLTGHYNNHCDVGPTDDHSGMGIPETDDIVGFEDLMIFALNFGNVAPRQPLGGSTGPVLVWQRVDDTTWSLVLSESCADLKGLHLTARLPEGVSCEVVSGDLLDDQAGPGFVANTPTGLDVGVALLGRGASICGDGELVRVSFSEDVVLTPRVTARSGENANLAVDMSTAAEAATPLLFSAAQNFPNPFNPKTTISFALPEGRDVRLAVYALDGSLVRVLVNGALPAGTHDIVWDGRDDRRQGVATGAYFYRIEAGPDSEVRKMLLMK